MPKLNLTESMLGSLPDPLPRGGQALSSVLAIIGRNAETSRDEILLTKRTEQVGTHKGQISFPGGFWQNADSDLLATALRESEEEIGLKPGAVKIFGSLEPVRTRDNILIYPWVGKAEFPYPFEINSNEVASLLFLPVVDLLSCGLQPVTVVVSEELTVESRGISVGSELVWGATARMLEQLREKLLRFYR